MHLAPAWLRSPPPLRYKSAFAACARLSYYTGSVDLFELETVLRLSLGGLIRQSSSLNSSMVGPVWTPLPQLFAAALHHSPSSSGHVHSVDVNVVLSSALSRRRPLPFMRHRVATVAKTAHAVVC